MILSLVGLLGAPVGCAMRSILNGNDNGADFSGGGTTGSGLDGFSLLDVVPSPGGESPGSPVPDLRPGGDDAAGGAGVPTGDTDTAFEDAPDDVAEPIDGDVIFVADDGGADVVDTGEPGDDVRPPETQAGVLTAGSFDDNLNYDVFTRFVSESLHGDANAAMPRIALGQRVMILVRDRDGDPVGDAQVVVTPAGDEGQQLQPVVNQTTGSDGRVLFLTEWDAAADFRAFSVVVHPPDGSSPIVETRNLDETPWEITLPSTDAAAPAGLDLAFVVDATGSMLDEIEFLKAEVGGMVTSIRTTFPDVDQRYALIVYRDEGDDYLTRTFDFTGDIATFQRDLANQVAAGGGDYPEAMHLALEGAEALSWRGRETARVLFLIADAPPHAEFAARTLDSVNALRKATVALYPVAASGVADEAEFIMRIAAFASLSQYLFLTDDSGVGNPHAEPHIPCYHVERLDQLMVRVIASELAGRAIYPTADQILRTVGNPVEGVCMPDETAVVPGQEQ